MNNKTKQRKKNKYRFLTKEESDAIKNLLPAGWPDTIIAMAEKRKDAKIPARNTLYGLVNGRVKNLKYMDDILKLVEEQRIIKKKIRDAIAEETAA